MSVKRKPGRPKVNPEKKLCLKCRQAKTLDSFFRNAGWAEQLYHDTWCKPCARGFAKTKETLREYVWNNNREWREAFWLRAVDNALLKLGNNKAYLNANERKQKVLLEEEACNLYLTKMNMAQNYVYSPNVSPEDMNYGGFEDHEERLEREHRAMQEAAEENAQTYDATWNGLFTRRELEYLNRYYEDLEKDYDLDDVNIRDYGRKVAKASLTVDTLYSGLATGAVSQKDYKAAMDNFDMLSKSANFAACKKKDGGSATVLPLGEVVEYLEQHKKIKVKKNAWSADAVTGIMGDLYHVVESLGLERM